MHLVSYITCRTDIIRFIFYVVATNNSDCGFKVDPCPADETFDHTLFSDGPLTHLDRGLKIGVHNNIILLLAKPHVHSNLKLGITFRHNMHVAI